MNMDETHDLESAPSRVPGGDYRPSEDEPFMNVRQQAYFRQILLAWQEDLRHDALETLGQLKSESANVPEIGDQASLNIKQTLELRTRDRQRKLLAKIEKALAKLEDGTYGYCEATGVPITLERLMARPVAFLSLQAQQQHEQNEKKQRHLPGDQLSGEGLPGEEE